MINGGGGHRGYRGDIQNGSRIDPTLLATATTTESVLKAVVLETIILIMSELSLSERQRQLNI
jgi:hypothetical protein